MSDDKMIQAQKVYNNLCKAIDNRGWKYKKDEPELVVYFGVNGDDIPMDFILVVDAKRQLIRVMSPLPFNMAENKRVEGALATCVASYSMVDGSFDYDLTDGKIVFRMTASFLDSEIGEDLFQYLISCSCAMVDRYNDKFLAINNGTISVEQFIAEMK